MSAHLLQALGSLEAALCALYDWLLSALYSALRSLLWTGLDEALDLLIPHLKRATGWAGWPAADVCAALAGGSAAHWTEHAEACERTLRNVGSGCALVAQYTAVALACWRVTALNPQYRTLSTCVCVYEVTTAPLGIWLVVLIFLSILSPAGSWLIRALADERCTGALKASQACDLASTYRGISYFVSFFCRYGAAALPLIYYSTRGLSFALERQLAGRGIQAEWARKGLVFLLAGFYMWASQASVSHMCTVLSGGERRWDDWRDQDACARLIDQFVAPYFRVAVICAAISALLYRLARWLLHYRAYKVWQWLRTAFPPRAACPLTPSLSPPPPPPLLLPGSKVLRAEMFARISSSRGAMGLLCAFAGGALPTTVLSCCAYTLLQMLSPAALKPLEATCREAARAVAAQPRRAGK